MKTRLEKYGVCNKCFSASIIDPDCVCAHGKYKAIVLEFEVCDCCGGLINDGRPADTQFNKEQIKNYSFYNLRRDV